MKHKIKKAFMKKILFYSIIIALGFISSCKIPVGEQKASLTISAKESFSKRFERGSIFKKSSNVSGFEHQYDTCFLLITNENTGDQDLLKKVGEPIFNNISLSVGSYNFFMYTNEADSISHFMEFIAKSGLNIDIKPGINELELQQEPKQGLLVIDSLGIENHPSCKVGDNIGPMSQYGKYYYNYVKGDAIVSFRSDGGDKQKYFQLMIDWIQTFFNATGSIKVKEGFQNIRQS